MPVTSIAATQISLILLAVAGVVIALLSTSLYGVGLSPDSIEYIHAARSLQSGDGLLVITGETFASWPPLFPGFLAALGLAGIDPYDGARLLNAVVFGLIIYTSGQLLGMHIRSNLVLLLGTAAVLLSFPLLAVSIVAWSEPLLVLLSVLFVIYLTKFLSSGKPSHLLLMSIFAGLACLDKWLGLPLVFAGLAAIVFRTGTASAMMRARYVAVFGLISSVPLALWLGRNYASTSTLTGGRAYDTYSISQHIGFAFDVFISWLVPSQYLVSEPIKLLLAAVVVAGVASLIAAGVRNKYVSNTKAELKNWWPPAMFVGIYALFLVIAEWQASPDRIDNRLLSPIYVFVILFLFIGIEGALNWGSRLKEDRSQLEPLWLTGGVILVLTGVLLNEWVVAEFLATENLLGNLILSKVLDIDGDIQTRYRVLILLLNISSVAVGIWLIAFRKRYWVPRAVVIGLCCMWLIYPLLQTSFHVAIRMDNGAGGYNTTLWNESELIQWLRGNPLDGQVFSNDHWAIYFSTLATVDSGAGGDKSSIRRAEDLLSLGNSRFLDQDSHLVWYDDEQRHLGSGFEELASTIPLTEIATFRDGAVYSIR